MRKHKILSLAVAMMMLFPVGVALAQTESSAPSPEPTTQTFDEKKQARDKLETKINEEREDLIESFSQAREQQLTRRCETARLRLQAALTNANAVYANRSQLYQNVLDKVNDVISRLSLNDQVDTSEVSTIAETLQTDITAFFASFDIYIASLEAAINDEDCSESPEDFHLLLESAKALRGDLKDAAKDIRELLVGDFKDALKDLKQSLEETESSETSEEEAN